LEGSFQAIGLFADTSGFTAMTDALIEHGQHGAEVLAGVMNTVFTPLFQTVFEQGGFVATQAGDAFTAVFPCDSDPQTAVLRALSAACNIQQAMLKQPTHHTPYGEFSVSVKVGLALGDAAWGIIRSADQRHAAYYFQGTAIDGSSEAEHRAQAGEILIDPILLNHAPDNLVTEPFDGFYRLVAFDQLLPACPYSPAAAIDLHLAGKFFPEELYTRNLGGEIRQVCCLFINLPTVKTKSQLHIFMQTLFELQDVYGGLPQLLFGDKGAHLRILWGAPTSHENDIERMLNFILELQSRTAIPVKAGATVRIAYSGFIGSHLAEDYTAFGRGTNLAARFMSTAPRGEIWLDENIAYAMARHFVLDDLGEHSFKGFSRPQKVFLLLERDQASVIHYSGKMVGREQEVSALRQFIQPLSLGEYPGMLVVWGEPGLGKSRLVHTFLDELQRDQGIPCQTFLAQTDEILRRPLNPFRYWLLRYFGVSETQGETRNKRTFNRKLDELIGEIQDVRLVEELDRTRSLLGALVDLYWPDSLFEQLDARGRYENTFIALTCLLEAESLRQPVVLFIEDIHWLDEDSQAFLLSLQRALSARRTYPVALLATARWEGSSTILAEVDYRSVHLTELDRKALADLSEFILGAPAGMNLLELLVDKAQGNPFFAEQILYYLRDENRLIQKHGTWEVSTNLSAPIPAEVGSVLIARLDRLSEDVREVVQTAAILGREFDILLLSRMLNDDRDLSQKIDRAEREAIWSALNEIRYLFRHALMRDAAYNMQLQVRREALHALALSSLEILYAEHLDPHFAELAHHAEQAGLSEKAAQYYHLAGNSARSAYQNKLAADYYSRALELTPIYQLDRRYQLLADRELIYNVIGKIQDRLIDLKTLQELVNNLNDPSKIAEVTFRLSYYAIDIGNYIEARQQASKAVDLARAAKTAKVELKARRILIAAHHRLRELDQAIIAADECLRLIHQMQDSAEESAVLSIRGLIFVEQGKPELATADFLRGVDLARQANSLEEEAKSLNNLGVVTSLQGDLIRSRDFYERSLIATRKVGDRLGEGRTLGNVAFITSVLGDFPKALAYADQTLQITREVGDRYGEMYVLVNLSLYARCSGDLNNAVEYARQAAELAARLGDRSGSGWAYTRLGSAHLALGELDQAQASFQQSIKIREELDQPTLATEPLAGLAQVFAARSELDRASHSIDRLLAFFDRGGILEGTDEPLRVYLTCYQILKQTGHKRAAEFLQIAYDQLQDRSSQILDETARHNFIQNVAEHREILAAWQNEHASTTLKN
jgi:class 3 adenylate cyclase/tetratricopeptide (TPR) repeat protein